MASEVASKIGQGIGRIGDDQEERLPRHRNDFGNNISVDIRIGIPLSIAGVTHNLTEIIILRIQCWAGCGTEGTGSLVERNFPKSYFLRFEIDAFNLPSGIEPSMTLLRLSLLSPPRTVTYEPTREGDRR